MSTFLDPAAIAVAKSRLWQFIQSEPLSVLPTLADAIANLHRVLPEPMDAIGLLTWATAAETLMPDLSPQQYVWVQALQVLSMALRRRAQTMPAAKGSYG